MLRVWNCARVWSRCARPCGVGAVCPKVTPRWAKVCSLVATRLVFLLGNGSRLWAFELNSRIFSTCELNSDLSKSSTRLNLFQVGIVYSIVWSRIYEIHVLLCGNLAVVMKIINQKSCITYTVLVCSGQFNLTTKAWRLLCSMFSWCNPIARSAAIFLSLFKLV